MILVIGAKSVGKSTFTNFLRGTSKFVTCRFIIGEENGSALVTNVVTATIAYWLGDDGEDRFTILDTPGLANPNGENEYRTQFKEMAKVLKNLRQIHTIIQVVKGKDKAYNKPDHYDENLEILKYMFGEAMKTQLINEVTFWKNYEYSEIERVEFAEKMTKNHQGLFKDRNAAITTVFIDPIDALMEPYVTEFKSLYHGCPKAEKVQKKQIDKLKEFIWNQKSKPFSCSEKCQIVGDLFTTRSPYPTGSPYLYSPIGNVAKSGEIIIGTHTVLECKIASLKVGEIDPTRVMWWHNDTMIQPKPMGAIPMLVLQTLTIIPYEKNVQFVRKFRMIIREIKWTDAGTYACSYGDLLNQNNLLIKVTENTNCKPDYEISPWSEWSECAGICGNATQARNRKVSVTETAKSGSPKCDAPTDDHRYCYAQECKGQMIFIIYSLTIDLLNIRVQ